MFGADAIRCMRRGEGGTPHPDWPSDISIFTYSNKSVGVPDSSPQGLDISVDGYKLFVAGAGNDLIYEYSLTTPFDLSTAIYSGTAVSISSQDVSPSNIFFSNSGLGAYMVGYSSDRVHQYIMTTSYDLSTLTYTGKSFSVASQDTTPRGLTFTQDGVRMFVCGTGSDSVHEYILSTAWDVTSAAYANTLSVSAVDGNPMGLAISPDGTTLYIAGDSSDGIHQYDISTGLASGVKTGFLYCGSQESQIRAVRFSPTGDALYITGVNSDAVHEYSTS